MLNYHLGIHYGHNATVAVVESGKLVFCQSEERLNRIKNSTGFPVKTLEYVYKHICNPGQVASATLFQESNLGYLFLKNHGFEPFQYGYTLSPEAKDGGLLSHLELGWKLSQWRAKEVREKDIALESEATSYFAKALQVDISRIHTVKHHFSHAFSAVPNIKDWNVGLVFTLDGAGDYISGTVSKWDGEKLDLLQMTDHRNSLGYLYSATTAVMGMKSGEHEFKVMGLAPYAKREYYLPILEKLTRLMWLDNKGEIVARFPPTALTRELEKIYRFQRFDSIAGAIQEFTEQIILGWVEFWMLKTEINNVAVSGGVFMNVKACQKLRSSENIEKMFVVPSAADESTAIGAAFATSVKLEGETPIQPIKDLYLGREYSEPEIDACFKDKKVSDRYQITRPKNINHTVARMLSENNVVARFSGRMEFGARALGNRSILANPNSFRNVEIINSAIKSRDFWMPFTPSVLEGDMPRYIVDYNKIHAPYMCITFDTTEEARNDLPAAIHPRDNTARPQCVIKSWNSEYYDLIEEFKKLTGIGAVLNTSFNLHGEPNVCSPDDAIHTIDSSGLKYLAIGPYLLTKK